MLFIARLNKFVLTSTCSKLLSYTWELIMMVERRVVSPFIS